jgi:molybdopterin converting factor subunit 1
MKLTVMLFASARQIANASQLELEFEHSPTVVELHQELVRRHPDLAELAAKSIFAINHEFSDAGQLVTSTDEIALIPPVSGG